MSCNKNKPGNNYFLRFKIDGVDKTYTGHLFAHTDTTSGCVTLTIVGATSATSVNKYMGIYLDNFPAGSPTSTGQYDDQSTTHTLLTTHAKNGIDYEAGQSVAEDAAFWSIAIANHFKADISSVHGITARGTFSGDYYADGDVRSGTKLVITYGEFFVKFQ